MTEEFGPGKVKFWGGDNTHILEEFFSRVRVNQEIFYPKTLCPCL